MNDKRLFEITDLVDWVNSGDLTREEEIELYKSLEKDPAAREEFGVINAIWNASPQIFEEEPIPEIEKVTKAESSGATDRVREWFGWVGSQWPVRIAAVSAVVLIMVAGIWFSQRDTANPIVIHATATGEQKRVYLSDRSMIFLDSETELSVAFSDELRRIELNSGRASFSVSKDLNRPFVVSVGEYSVVAVGTVFDVYKYKEDVLSVTVTEGRVQVRKQNNTDLKTDSLPEKTVEKSIGKTSQQHKANSKKGRPDKGLIDSGHKLIVDSRLKVYEVKEVDAKTVDEWRSGRLIFRGTPFEDVVNEINRYLENKIVIDDDHLKQLSTNFIFNIRDRRSFLAILEQTLPITSRKTSDGKIIIKRKI